MANRYLAQQKLPEIGSEGQKKLAASKVLVVGCGGLAAAILPYLAAAGVGTITLIDDDSVSQDNLNRQILFVPSDIGKNKVLIARHRLQQQNPEINIVALIEKFCLTNGIGLVQSHDLIIDCSDSYSSKVTINYCCIQSKTALVYGSVLGWDGQVALLTMSHVTDPCYKCWQRLAPQNMGSCTDDGVLGTSVSMIGSYQVSLAIQYLLGYLHNANYLFVFDLWSLEQKRFKLNQHHDCKLHSNYSQLQYIAYSELGRLENYILFDIRTIDEWESGHLPQARHISPGKLIQSNQHYTKEDNLVIYCNQEVLSKLVAENLQSMGYTTFVLKGGYSAYEALKA